MNTPCAHARVQVISQDDSGKFLECLDCKEIFEASELDQPAPQNDPAVEPKPERKEDLSDA